MTWLPPSKRGAVCLSLDDAHPSAAVEEALGHVEWLQGRHPQLKITIFTTPDWRTIDPYPTRKWLARVPVVRHHVFTVAVHPRGTFRLDRHEPFCARLRNWSGVEVALHGLQHVRRGLSPVLEFANHSAPACRALIDQAIGIFERARVPFVRGLAPPGWHAPRPLLEAMSGAGLSFIASARDLETPIARGASANGRGLTGVSLLGPQRIDGGLIHIPTNFQATSDIDRATAIIDCGGLLSIKAHALAASGAYRALDGLTIPYRDYLDRVIGVIEDRYGDSVLWTSMSEVAARCDP